MLDLVFKITPNLTSIPVAELCCLTMSKVRLLRQIKSVQIASLISQLRSVTAFIAFYSVCRSFLAFPSLTVYQNIQELKLSFCFFKTLTNVSVVSCGTFCFHLFIFLINFMYFSLKASCLNTWNNSFQELHASAV